MRVEATYSSRAYCSWPTCQVRRLSWGYKVPTVVEHSSFGHAGLSFDMYPNQRNFTFKDRSINVTLGYLFSDR